MIAKGRLRTAVSVEPSPMQGEPVVLPPAKTRDILCIKYRGVEFVTEVLAVRREREA